jgi:hypothetical protein
MDYRCNRFVRRLVFHVTIAASNRPITMGTSGAPALSRRPTAKMEAPRKNFHLFISSRHFHSITTKMAAIMAANTSAGAVNGLSKTTLRTDSCCSLRISCSCLRAKAS